MEGCLGGSVSYVSDSCSGLDLKVLRARPTLGSMPGVEPTSKQNKTKTEHPEVNGKPVWFPRKDSYNDAFKSYPIYFFLYKVKEVGMGEDTSVEVFVPQTRLSVLCMS